VSPFFSSKPKPSCDLGSIEHQGERLQILREVHTAIALDPKNDTSNRLALEIESSGAIPFSRFMQECLYGPDGYYSAGKVQIGPNRIGADFSTAPNASDLFGALVSKAAINTWLAMGRPERFDIIEIGAGQAESARGFLLAARQISPEFFKALHYIIIERSPELVQRQQQVLREQRNISWLNGSALEIPLRNVKGMIYSNELVDAFPVEVVVKKGDVVQQCFVSVKDGFWIKQWCSPSSAVKEDLEERKINLRDGIEEPINFGAKRFMQEAAGALEQGSILSIDYGHVGAVGRYDYSAISTFPQLQFNSPFKYPGHLDMTSWVDFSYLNREASRLGLKASFGGAQGDLFARLGVPDLMRLFEQRALQTDSLPEAARLAASIKRVGSILTRDLYGGFHSEFWAKDLDPAALVPNPLPEKYLGACEKLAEKLLKSRRLLKPEPRGGSAKSIAANWQERLAGDSISLEQLSREALRSFGDSRRSRVAERAARAGLKVNDPSWQIGTRSSPNVAATEKLDLVYSFLSMLGNLS